MNVLAGAALVAMIGFAGFAILTAIRSGGLKEQLGNLKEEQCNDATC